MKTAILVIGAESTGTRLFTRILIENGYWGQHTHEQETDDFPKGLLKDKDRVVIRRSLPHAQEFPDLGEILEYLNGEGFRVTTIVTFRSWDFATRSQVRRAHTSDTNLGFKRTARAYKEAFKFIEEYKVPYLMVSFDALIQDPEGQQRWLIEQLGTKVKKFVEIKNTNARYTKD